jgi:hypothetical protein
MLEATTLNFSSESQVCGGVNPTRWDNAGYRQPKLSQDLGIFVLLPHMNSIFKSQFVEIITSVM